MVRIIQLIKIIAGTYMLYLGIVLYNTVSIGQPTNRILLFIIAVVIGLIGLLYLGLGVYRLVDSFRNHDVTLIPVDDVFRVPEQEESDS